MFLQRAGTENVPLLSTNITVLCTWTIEPGAERRNIYRNVNEYPDLKRCSAPRDL
jgi:hypothetical protein